MKKIAIIGSGIAGLGSAYFLKQHGYAVHLIEANDYVGGHTHTIALELEGKAYAVDTGFIVFNQRSYPLFSKMLKDLNVASQETDMSFSVYDPSTQFQYAGKGLNGLFARRRHLFSPQFYGFIKEIMRFHQLAKAYLLAKDKSSSIRDFLNQHLFSDFFADNYLYPLIASLWSAPEQAIDSMPFMFVAHFFYNHALLQMIPDLPWQVVKGGSHSYVKALLESVQPQLSLNTKITRVFRGSTGIELYTDQGLFETFDEVVIALHSDQALDILDQASPLEREILSAFSYQANQVTLHQDAELMPSLPAAWASWNARRIPGSKQAVLTYDMNRLQGMSSPQPFLVTLNADAYINPNKVLGHYCFSHPQYTEQSLLAQHRQDELNQAAGIYFCGAYWGFGFHEDGLRSGFNACQALVNKLSRTS